MLVRISFHLGSNNIKNYYYEDNGIPVPSKGDIIILKSSDLDYYNDIPYSKNIILYESLYQFVVKSVDYLYEEDNKIYIYVNLFEYNNIKDKSNSVGMFSAK